MNSAHKAIIQAAKRDGLLPMELAGELLAHDLLESMLKQMRSHAVAFKNMSEQQQDAAIHDMQTELKKAVGVAIKTIATAGSESVRFTLKSMKIDSKLTVTGTVDAEDENRHVLTDKAHDKSDILLVLCPRDYFQGLDAIQGDKDQKPLPLDGEEATDKKPKAKRSTGTAKAAGEIAAKVIELPPALIDQAEEFVRNIQTATHAGVQNQFKIGFEKAEALLQALEDRGVITEKDKDGNRALVRVKAEPVAIDKAASKAIDANIEGLGVDEHGFVVMSDALYERAKAKVIKDQSVSSGGLAIAYDLDDTVAADLLDRLEMDGVISEANDLGGREVLQLA